MSGLFTIAGSKNGGEIVRLEVTKGELVEVDTKAGVLVLDVGVDVRTMEPGRRRMPLGTFQLPEADWIDLMGRYLKVVTKDKQTVSVSAFLDTGTSPTADLELIMAKLNELDDRPPTA